MHRRYGVALVMLVAALALLQLALADQPNFNNNRAYDQGELGSYPNQTFRSANLVVPRFNVLKAHPNPPRDLYTLLTLRGHSVQSKGPLIVDSQNHVVWFSEQSDNTYNLQVQQYNGRSVLTYWSGYDGYVGHGRGCYHVLDSSYTEILKVSAQHRWRSNWADQHELLLTSQGTAVLMIYEKRKVDLSAVDSTKSGGWIWDCLFQEIDMASRKELFRWRASDSIPLTLSFRPMGFRGNRSQPWDWFHLNSIDKDHQGNYLLSSRYTRSIIYVSGKDGSVIWTLGGKTSNFSDLSDGRATNFSSQHDARWQGKNKISLFNNAADDDNRSGVSSGMLLQVNTDSSPMTVTFLEEYVHPDRISSISQGNMQILPGSKNVVIGWGYAASWTEFAKNGSIIEDVRFQPSTEFRSGNVESYRALKMQWKGFPKTQPSLVVHGSSVYVSWNGATEVNHWMLQATKKVWSTKPLDWADVASEERQGFETVFYFEEEQLRKYLRVVAFNAEGKVLGKTKVVDWRFSRVSSRSLAEIPNGCLRQSFALDDVPPADRNQKPWAKALNLTSVSSLMPYVAIFLVFFLILLRISRRYLRRIFLWRPSRHRGRRRTLLGQKPPGPRLGWTQFRDDKDS